MPSRSRQERKQNLDRGMEVLHSVLRVAETMKIKCNVIKLRIQLKCESVLGKSSKS